MKHKFFHRYLSAKVLPIWTILLIDVLIIVVSSLLAYALRYDFRSIFLESSTIDKTIVCTVIVNLVFFRIFRTYSNVLRFSSFIDIMRIFVSLTVLSQIALNWCAQKEFVSSCIVGAQSRRKIEENCAAYQWMLTSEEIALLDAAIEQYLVEQ